MKNRPPIYTPMLSLDIHHFAVGYGGEKVTPVQIAWSLENTALQQGWRAGESLGSEDELMNHFGVNRDRLREAVRIIEARGAMRMQRGRHGGLRMLQPDMQRVSHALALYLRACGYSSAALARAREVADPLFAELPADSVLVKLYQSALMMLFKTEHHDDAAMTRSLGIATNLVERTDAAALQSGVLIGPEATLCEEFSCSRSTIRQALRILDDIGMLQVRRGRGGGYSLKPPTSIGIVRQVFALLVSQRLAIADIMPVIWTLNLAQLKLAMRELSSSHAERRDELSRALTSTHPQSPEPQRWVLIQTTLGRIANDAMVSVLLQCFVAYFARINPPTVDYLSHQERMLRLETLIVDAVLRDDVDIAEHHQRAVHSCLSELLGC